MVSKKCREIFALTLAFVECLCFGAIIHGWPSLVFVLQQDGIFEHLCYLEGNMSKQATVNSSISWDGRSTTSWNSKLGDNSRNERRENHYVDRDSFILKKDHLPSNDNLETTANSVRYTVQSSDEPGGEEEKHETLSCPARDRMLNLVYIVSVMTLMLSTTLQGKLFDRFGLRVLRMLASVIFVPGGLMMAFASREHPFMVFPGMALMGTAGMTLIMTNNHVTLLAKDKKSTISAIYSGATDCSIWVFLVVKILWEHGIGRHISLVCLTALWGIVIVNTFAFVPKYKVNWDEQKIILGVSHGSSVSRDRHGAPSLRECLSSPVYWIHCVWFSLMMLRMVCYFGTFNLWVNEITHYDVGKVSKMTNIFSYVLFCGIIFSPLLGFAMDWCKKKIFTTTGNIVGNAYAAVPVLFFHCIISIFLSASVLIPNDFFIYLSFFFFVVYRVCLFGIYYAFFNLAIPQQHYGILLGIATSLGGLSILFQFPLLLWIERSPLTFVPVNVFLLVLCVLTLAHPISICILNKIQARRNYTIPRNETTSRNTQESEPLKTINNGHQETKQLHGSLTKTNI